MTPADLAMKNALDESVRYANSPPAMASAAHPLMAGQPERNVTSFELQSRNSSDPVGPSLTRPVTPHVTLHQFRQWQQSPALSSSPDLDYKRVRRKPSFTDLVRRPYDLARLPAQTTSFSPSLHPSSPQNFLPSLLPPVPLTPTPRPSTTSPSLSSTVDTLQSTPTHTPIQHGGWPLGPWGGFDRVELSEPIRTKRKFPQFKQAKRLPHITAHDGGGGGIWEVHAAVVDLGDVYTGDLEAFSEEARAQASGVGTSGEERLPSSGRKGRTVRFEGVETDESSSGNEESRVSEPPRPDQEKEPSLTSSFSLSKFNFPEPPRSAWTGTFGHFPEATPPTSPTTLSYRGASFDVVNPHASLLLGVSDIETPAEIDGLLDDYFNNNRDSATMAYNDPTGEKAASQQSFQTSSSNGRQRVLYDDPESARRRIMGIPGSGSQPPLPNTPRHDSALTQRSNEQTPFTGLGPHRPGTPIPFEFRSENRGLQIHPNLREALNVGGPNAPDAEHYEVNRLAGDYEGLSLEESRGAATLATPAIANTGEEAARAYDRGSSLYPHSQRSNPFDLSISDVGEDRRGKNIDGVIGATRSSYYAGDGALHDQEEDFMVYEDAPDANATQSAHETDTTVGNIVSHYHYSRPPLAPLASPEGIMSSSSSAETARGEDADIDPFQGSAERSMYSMETGTFENPRIASRIEGQWPFNFTPQPMFSRTQRPPNLPIPTPPTRAGETGAPHGHFSIYSDSPTTDQTYGNTGQLLQLTPQEGGWPLPGPGELGASVLRRPALPQERDGEWEPDFIARRPYTTIYPGAHSLDEDKENAEPQGTRAEVESTLSMTPTTFQPTWSDVRSRVRGPATVNNLAAQAIPRSSSYYPDDDSSWASTQASESRVNLGAQGAESDEGQGLRPSQESYADTSIAGSNPRLSLPRPVAPGISSFDSDYNDLSDQFFDRPSGSDQSTPRLDPTTSAERDEMLARRILEAKIDEDTTVGGVGSTTPKRDQAQYIADMRELERLRRNNPTAVEKAVKHVADKLGNISQVKPTFSPQSSFSKANPSGAGKKTHDSPYSDTQGLLEGRADSPYMSGGRGGLRFSETANTFNTSRGMRSMATGTPIKPYSPLNPTMLTPPANALVRDRANTASTRVASGRTIAEAPFTEEIEMQPLRKKKHVSRVAMSSQTELRPLELVDTTGHSGLTGRLTDAQLAEAEPGWTTRPDFTRDGALARLTRRNSGPTSFLIRQADGTLERSGLLMRPDEARNLRNLQEQKDMTRPYYQLCIMCPISAAIFGLGFLDWKIKAKTDGAITEMAPKAKKKALIVYVPLGLVIYTAIGLMIALIVLVTE